jgi:hypothetical protein
MDDRFYSVTDPVFLFRFSDLEPFKQLRRTAFECRIVFGFLDQTGKRRRVSSLVSFDGLWAVSSF